MKARVTYNFTKAQQEAFDKEINRQMAEWMEEHQSDIYKVICESMHHEFGFGAERLKRMLKAFHQCYDRLEECYKLESLGIASTIDFLCDLKLEKINVNVDAWIKEFDFEFGDPGRKG